MIVYIDSSVLMRIVLVQASPLPEWDDLEHGVSSELLIVEGFRTFDRLWHNDELTESDLTEKRRSSGSSCDGSTFSRSIARCSIWPHDRFPPRSRLWTPSTRYRASQPADERPIVFATHDTQLARAARGP